MYWKPFLMNDFLLDKEIAVIRDYAANLGQAQLTLTDYGSSNSTKYCYQEPWRLGFNQKLERGGH